MTAPATTPLSYNGFVTQIGVMAVVGSTTPSSGPGAGITVLNDPAAQAIIPQMLNYAELRIQRDLDIDQALAPNTSYSLTAANNILSLDTDDFITVESMQVVVNGVPMPLTPTSKEFIQMVYNSPASAGVPQFLADVGGDLATGGVTLNNYMVGPVPDASYPLIIYGVQRLPTLNNFGANSGTASTSFTFISTYYPDMLIMAAMVFISAYQRNFGRMSDDPSMAQSYEAQYQVLKIAAIGEEDRRRFQGDDWTSQAPSAIATERR